MLASVSMDASELLPNLYVGGRPQAGPEVGSMFDVMVMAEREYQPEASKYPGVKIIRAPIRDDDPTIYELRRVDAASTLVAEAVASGHNVLVVCAQGLNRSAFIAAMALRKLGWKARDAIKLLRERRGGWALSNPAFEKIVRTS